MTEIDTSFLDAEYWRKQNIDKAQLVDMFMAEYERVKKDNPDLPEDEIEINAEEDLKSTIASYKKGGASMGKGVSFGVTGLFDYTRMWRLSQIKAYEELVDGKKKFVVIYFKGADGNKTSKRYTSAQQMIDDKMIKIVVKKNGEKEIVALDKRGGDKRGKSYPESSNLATFIAMWTSSLTKKRYVVEATIGGEQGDTIVNPKCNECGSDSFGTVCEATIEDVVNGHKVKRKCGAKREGYEVPSILDACGNVSSFALKIKTNDKKEFQGIEWAQDQTKIVTGQKLDVKMSYDRGQDGKIIKNPQGQAKKSFSGELMSWIPSDRTITSKLVNDVWTKNKTMTGKEAVAFWNKYGGKAVFIIGALYTVGSVYYGNRRGSIIDDTTAADGDDGLPIKIPDHVYYRQMKDKFGKKSICLFVGKLDREQEKDFKSKKYKTAKIKIKSRDGSTREEEVPIYSKPFISISCIIPIKAQLADDDKEKVKVKVNIPDTKKVKVKADDVSEEEVAASLKKMEAIIADVEETTEETTDEITEEAAEESNDDGETSEQGEGSDDSDDESDDTEPESEDDEDVETVDGETFDRGEAPTTDDAAEAPEEVESLEEVDKVEKKTKKKRDYSKVGE